MIRVYLDWNIISNLKKPEFQEIAQFIQENKDCFQFPYSPAHFHDLMKSYQPNNEFFQKDLESLEYLSEKHLLRWGKDGIEVLFGTPKEYFEGQIEQEDPFSLMDMEKVLSDLDESTSDIGLGNIGKLMKSLFQLAPSGIEITDENRDVLNKMFPNLTPQSSMWDLMKDIAPFSKNLLQDREYYKDFRNMMTEQGFKLESNSGNWSKEEVIKNIDTFLSSFKLNMTYLEYVETTFKHKKEPANAYEFYTTAYLMLDLIGFRRDKLPKPTDNMQNIQADAEHSFYGGYCDYFIADDKNLRIKTEILYNEFNIPTPVLESSELISTLSKALHQPNGSTNILTEAFSFCQEEAIVEHYPITDENEFETTAYKLPFFYFNFFTYVILTQYPKQEVLTLTFKRVFKNYSTFIYYTESERLIDKIVKLFGFDDKEELAQKKQDFVYSDKHVEFVWSFKGGLIRLDKSEDSSRPELSYIISTRIPEDESPE